MKQFLKKHGFNLTMLIIFLIGTAIVAYPTISDYHNSKVQSKVISEYKEAIDNSKELEQIKAAARIYNDALYTSQKYGKPIANQVAAYDDVLNVAKNGVMGYIDIPIINVELPVYHGTEDDILRVAVGHAENSSVPIGGENTHCLLLGHRGLPTARLFNDIDQLIKGDYFELHILDEVLVYEVYKIQVVEPSELNKLRIEKGKDLVTLITCTPYGINTHRLLVHAKRISRHRQSELIYADARKINPAYATIAIGIFLWSFTMFLIIYTSSKNLRSKISRKELLRRNAIIDKYRNGKGGG